VPRLVKGGKWVYGWVAISAERKMPILPEAWQEYDFQAGDQVLFLRGSRRSGGFGISTPERIAERPNQRQLSGRGSLGRWRQARHMHSSCWAQTTSRCSQNCPALSNCSVEASIPHASNPCWRNKASGGTAPPVPQSRTLPRCETTVAQTLQSP